MLPAESSSDTGCRLGVLSFGDSITNAGGPIQRGIAMQSWALWTARGLGIPYTPYAVDGATAGDVTGWQIPAFEQINAARDARYQLGTVYVGTNDVRRPDWEVAAFEEHLDAALSFLAERCDRVLTATLPLDLGRPRTGNAKVEGGNRAIKRAAARHRALVLDLSRFGARNLIMVDRVHPTAFGQIAIAERALALLEHDGMIVRVRPSLLISAQLSAYRPNRVQSLRGDLKYAYTHALTSARAFIAQR